LVFGDLYEREDVKAVFRGAGVAVAEVGVGCAPYTSVRHGLARQIDKVRAFPRYCLIAHRLRRAAQTVDVVYVHTYKELVLAAWSGARIVWHCHGLDGVPPFTAHLARLCAGVIAISDTVAEALREIGVHGDRITTILNAIDTERMLTAAAPPPIAPFPIRGTAPVVLVPTASIRANKGIHVLLQAAQEVPELEIWIAGDMRDSAAGGYAEHLLELSRSPKLSGRVHFIGFRPDIYSVMRAADIVCVPSVCREGFGLAAAEAMALGKPVIVSNRGALPDVVQQGEAGIIIDPDRPQELTSALQRLITGSQYAQRLGAHAASYARLRFSYDRWAETVAQVLRDAFCQHSAERSEQRIQPVPPGDTNRDGNTGGDICGGSISRSSS
jgi:glycosyltransferase involved in cell wall biosynthesis